MRGAFRRRNRRRIPRIPPGKMSGRLFASRTGKAGTSFDRYGLMVRVRRPP